MSSDAESEPQVSGSPVEEPSVEQEQQTVDTTETKAAPAEEEASGVSDIEDVDEDAELDYLEEEDAFKLKSHKRQRTEEDSETSAKKKAPTRARKRRADVEPEELGDNREIAYVNESEDARRRRELEERLDASIKNKTARKKKKDEDDIEMFQDAAIAELKERMKAVAEIDKESVMSGEPALEKLKLLPEVRNVLLRADLADSILDNNLLESVRIWLEPLPGASLPAYEIQKTLFQAIVTLPIKTIHLQESGLGKIMLFYQRSKKIEPSIKRIADKLIGDWTRPIMKRSDNYRDKNVQSALFDYHKFKTTPMAANSRVPEQKTLYEEAAARRKRAAAPAARTSAYRVAPKVNPDIFKQRSRDISGVQSSLKDERFKSLSKKLNSMSSKKKGSGKGGISIEGKELGA